MIEPSVAAACCSAQLYPLDENAVAYSVSFPTSIIKSAVLLCPLNYMETTTMQNGKTCHFNDGAKTRFYNILSGLIPMFAVVPFVVFILTILTPFFC